MKYTREMLQKRPS